MDLDLDAIRKRHRTAELLIDRNSTPAWFIAAIVDAAQMLEALASLTTERDQLAAGPTWRDWQLTRERMAELEQERNELRTSAPEEMIRLRRALSTSNVRLERAEAERDAAQARLVEEQRDHAATRAEAARGKRVIDNVETWRPEESA
jgi:chromosome segregation ATPase